MPQLTQPRALAWDVKGDYARLPGWRFATRLADLRDLLKAHPTQPLKVALVPASMKWFEVWCDLGFAWGWCDLIAEELSDVSRPGKAPDSWGVILRRGRDQGLRVFATAQRPAEIDTTIFGNWTRFRTHQLMRAEDREKAAREMNVEQSRIDGLKQFEWLEVNRRFEVSDGTTRPIPR